MSNIIEYILKLNFNFCKCKRRRKTMKKLGALTAGCLVFMASAFSQENIREEIEVLKEEIRQLRLEIAMPEITMETYSGLGPAASKALLNPRGISIGGYGQIFYMNKVNTKESQKAFSDVYRVIVYLGYAFTEKLKFNSEIEWEHSSETAIEFAFVDYLFNPAFGIRGGTLLTPVGIINELHEPPTYFPVYKPYLEKDIIPTAWRENGFGFYGQYGPAEYRFYVMNGFRAEQGSYDASAPLKKLRQKASKALTDSMALTGRIDFNLPKSLKVGVSGFFSGIQDTNGKEVGRVNMISPHIMWKYAGFDIRFLGAFVSNNNAEEVTLALSEPICLADRSRCNVFPENMGGYYIQVAYDIFRFFDMEDQELFLFAMYEDYDRASKVPAGYPKPDNSRVNIVNLGIMYKPHPLVGLKADYVNEREGDTAEDIVRAEISWMF